MNAFFVVRDGFEAEHGEDIDGGEGCGEDCDDAHEDGIFLAVVVRWVVRSEGDERTEGQAEGVEYLTCRVHPHIRIKEL